MSTSIPIQNARVLAAKTPPESKAPFNRALLLVEGAQGGLLWAHTFTSAQRIEGPALTSDEMDALVETGQAIELPEPIPLESATALWVLRPNLPRRDQALSGLRGGSVLTREPLEAPGNSWLCLVNEAAPGASELRDGWRDEAIQKAEDFAREGLWKDAEREAEIAHSVSKCLDPEVLALLALTHEQNDRGSRARGLLQMARRSRGEEFAAQVAEARERIRGRLTPRTRASDDLERAIHDHFPKQRHHLGVSRSARLAEAA